ncbi:MAG TPA: DUF1080 domain-containing protein, partial [Planctomycetota bacterium]|nr:DUF1080 domain-containing protein [Planctomycetota bacterium]
RRILIRELPPEEARHGQAIVLFGGRDLDPWDSHLRAEKIGDRMASPADVWSINGEGLLVCRGEPWGYLYTKERHDNYILRVTWRFDPVTRMAGNSGVLLRMTGEHKVWPRSIEAQLKSGFAGDFWNIGQFPMQVVAARTYGRNTRKTHGNERRVGAWNDYEIIVDGPWVQLRVNGDVVNEAWDCETTAGHICLQSEGAEIHFKRVELVPLR